MSDNVAGAAAWLGGIEIVNDSRTTAYMQNGIRPPSLVVNGDCGCSNILQLAGCDTAYTTPAEDNAPWYDSAIPASAEFAGFLTTEFDGLASTYTRSVTEAIGDGATLGRSRFGSRTMTWKGYLFGSSCCGVAYGLRWLGKALQGPMSCGNSCSGEDLEILVCCPSMEAALGYGPNLICNGSFDNSTGFWQATENTVISWVNNSVYSDPGAMRAINPVGGPLTFSTSPDCIIGITGNKTYRIALQVKGASGSDSEVLGVTFRWFDNIDTFLGTTTLPNIGSDNSSTWTLLEGTVTSPVNAVRVEVDFTLGDGSTLPNQAHFFDEVQLNQTNFAPITEPFRTIKGVSLLEGPLVLSERKMGSTCGGSCGGSVAMEVEFSLIGSQPWLYSAPIPVVNCVNVPANSVPIIGSTLTGVLNDPGGISLLDTTIISNDFAFLPEVSFAGDLYIILDPYATAGAPEIVRVTAHAASSTSITVTRGQQGSSARSHADGTFWIVQNTECEPFDCSVDLLELVGGACATPTLPPTPTYAGCTIPDVNTWDAVYITAPNTLWDSISEVVPFITIETGALPIVGARIGFYTSANNNPCGDLINTPPQCDLICDQLYFSALPASSKFYIDGRTKKMSISCGTNAVFPGEKLTLGPFSWPSFSCYGFCMEFAYNSLTGSEGLCISLSLVPRTSL